MLRIKLKGITKCNNMVANILLADPCPPQPTTLGDGKKVKIQPFQNMVMLHIKLMKLTNAATWKQIFCRESPSQPNPSDPMVGVKGSNSTFSEHDQVAYQIKGKHEIQQQYDSKYFASRPPPPRPTLGQNSAFTEQGHVASEHGHVAYKNKWNHKMQQHSTKSFCPQTPPPTHTHDPGVQKGQK